MAPTRAIGLLVTTLAVACGAQVAGSDGGTQTTDASSLESGVGDADAASPPEASPPEASAHDGNAPDADASDAPPPPPPDTFVNAAVGGGSACTSYPSLTEWLRIGTATAGHPNTVQDGMQSGGASVSLNCAVHPQGNGFDIQLTAIENGPNGGSLTISSPQGQGTVTMKPSSGVSATFAGMGGIVFREQAGTNDPTGCTITYEYDPTGSTGGVAGDQPVPTSPPIAAGRIWGHIKCPNAVLQTTPAVACDAEADFMFEQCTQ
jgi:hypothetical protein